PLKSPVLKACQLGPGLPTTAAPIMLVPFISQIATEPSSFCHRMSEKPSRLKSPVPLTCQLGPGLPRLAAPMTAVPFISQIAASPLSSYREGRAATSYGGAARYTPRESCFVQKKLSTAQCAITTVRLA